MCYVLRVTCSTPTQHAARNTQSKPAMSAQNPVPDYVAPDVVIAQLNFLATLPQEDLQELFTRAAQWVDLYPRQTLYEQDTPVTAVYVLVDGRATQLRRTLDGNGRPLQTLAREVGPGTLLGAYDFLFGSTYRTRARAQDSCRLLAIDASALSRLVFRFPDVRSKLGNLDRVSRLRAFPLVGALELVALGFLADALEPKTFASGDVLYRSGDVQESLYLIDQGQVRLDWDDGQVNWLGNGAVAGLTSQDRQSSLGLAERRMTHTATVQTTTKLFTIPRDRFHGLSGLNADRQGAIETAQREDVLETLSIFDRFSPLQRRHLAGFMSDYYLPDNRLLIQQGEEVDSLWVLMPGSKATIHALDSSGGKMVDTPTTGPTYFGETALLGQAPQDSTIEAGAASRWLRLNATDFRQCDEQEGGALRSKLRVQTKKREVIASEQDRKKLSWLQPGELVVLSSRRHWISFLEKNLPFFVLLAILFVVAVFAWILPGVQTWIRVVAGILLFFAVLALIYGTVDYFNDRLVVTNRRVVQQEKHLFMGEWRKEAPLEQIQNINFQTTFIGRWLNYGTMVIQTAASAGRIVFKYTTHFSRLNGAITEQREQRRRHAPAQSKVSIHRMLEQRLGLPLELPDHVYTIVPAVESSHWWARWRRLRKRPPRKDIGLATR